MIDDKLLNLIKRNYNTQYYLTMGRYSGKTALIRKKLEGGYRVVDDFQCASLYYIDDDKMSISKIDEAHIDISPTKYKYLVELGKKLKKNK